MGRTKHSELNEQSCQWNDSTTRIGCPNVAEWNFDFCRWKLLLILESKQFLEQLLEQHVVIWKTSFIEHPEVVSCHDGKGKE